MNGPRWIKQWIADLALLNEQFRNDDGSVDFEALGREEYMFRTALITQKLEKSERARETFMTAKAAYDASSENGKKGGRPRKNQDTTADAPTREDWVYPEGTLDAPKAESGTSAKNSEARQNQRGGEGSLRIGGHVTPSRTCRPPRDFEEVKDFIAQNGLDYDDARLWWERNYVERNGMDKDGKPIKNWKGALVNACKAEETKRRSA